MPGVAPLSFLPIVGGVVNESVPVIIGGALILLVVLCLVALLLRDLVRITLKIIALVVILGAVAMGLGWFDTSLAGDFLSSVGERVTSVYNSVMDRFTDTTGAPGAP